MIGMTSISSHYQVNPMWFSPKPWISHLRPDWTDLCRWFRRSRWLIRRWLIWRTWATKAPSNSASLPRKCKSCSIRARRGPGCSQKTVAPKIKSARRGSRSLYSRSLRVSKLTKITDSFSSMAKVPFMGILRRIGDASPRIPTLVFPSLISSPWLKEKIWILCRAPAS